MVAAVSIGPVLTSVLQTRREFYNLQVRQRRQATAGFDETAVEHLLLDLIDPVTRRLGPQDSALELVDSLFELGLELIAQRRLGRQARDVDLSQAWCQLLPQLPLPLLAAPLVPPALFNALFQLRSQPGADWLGWCRRISRLAALVNDPTALLDLGRVLAWQAGLAQLRNHALAALGRLPSALAAEVLQVPPAQLADSVRQLQQDPWWRPEGRSEQVRRVGGYCELGGAFRSPPALSSDGAHIWVGDGANHYCLFADAYGAVLYPATGPLPKLQGDVPKLDAAGQMHWAGACRAIDPLAAQGLAVCAGRTIAIASIWSHRLWVLPRP